MTIIVYFSYYNSALRFLAKMREVKRNMDSKGELLWNEIEKDQKQNLPVQMTLENFTMQQEIIQISDYSLATQIFSCMTVEAFINLYGVNSLGEDFYKRNLERMQPITQKIEVIVALVKREPLKKDDEVLKLTRRIFDRRNQLVHPKPKKIKQFDEIKNIEWEDYLDEAENLVKDMQLFFDLFKLIDPDSEDMIARMKQTP